jgi:hypothetical protein
MLRSRARGPKTGERDAEPPGKQHERMRRGEIVGRIVLKIGR